MYYIIKICFNLFRFPKDLPEKNTVQDDKRARYFLVSKDIIPGGTEILYDYCIGDDIEKGKKYQYKNNN